MLLKMTKYAVYNFHQVFPRFTAAKLDSWIPHLGLYNLKGNVCGQTRILNA